MVDAARSRAVAIVGMSARFPSADGGTGVDAFWRTIHEGLEVLETFSDADLDAARVDPAVRDHARYVRKGTALGTAAEFDASFFGFSPREAQVLDPQQRVFLECAWEALEDAGYAGAVAGQAVGVYAGVGMNTYLLTQVLANPPFVASVGGYQLMVGNDKDFLATRLSYKLDLRGPSLTIQTACSTSLVAVILACRAIQRGECDLALAGGVSIPFPQRGGYLFEEGMILSPDGHCRPFDEGAKGTRASAGAGIVVLKSLANALADGDTVRAVILGSAINNDGAGKAGYTAPSIEGQVEVIATAQALAGVDARSITYVEAHGTGTPLGDPIEIAALTQVFRASTPDVGFCRLGSLKANVGHLDAAAGVASLIKATLAFEHRELPPLVNFKKPNPQLALETSPFVASAAAAPWTASADGTPRRAGVSSFGIGGTNAHLVLEEAPAAAPSAPSRGAHLLILSAKTATALDRATADLAAHLSAHPEQSLSDVAWTLAAGRQAFAHRRAVVVRTAPHALEVLAQPGRPPVFTAATTAADGAGRPVAFLFSGQGSQHPGMGAGLHRDEPVYRDAVDRCALILEPHLGLDIRTVLFASEGDVAVHDTRLTQPALFVTSYALASLWKSWGIAPVAMLGHSVGEYVAAHLAGVFSLEDALTVVAARGRLMQEQRPGKMAAVHLPSNELQKWLEAGVEIAAVNAPGLCAVSGPADAIEKLLGRLEGAGIESRPLHTSHAFHSAMMEPALAPFLAVLERVRLSPPKIPYVSNLSGTWITPEQATSPAYYAEHLRRAVEFEAGVRALASDPTTLVLEVGPGTALTSLARLTLGKDGGKRAIASLAHPREHRAELESILEASARLWLAGVALDWKAMHAPGTPRRVPLPTYPFERKRHWVEALVDARVGALPSQGRAPDAQPAPRPIDGWFFAPTWTRDDASPPPPKLSQSWLILALPGPLGDALAAQVKAAGAAPVVVEPGERFERIDAGRFRVRPGVHADLVEVVQAVRASARIAGAFHLWSVDGAGSVGSVGSAASAPGADAAGATARSYHAPVAMVAALQDPLGSKILRVVIATSGAESVLDEPVADVAAAMVVGPVLVLPTEVMGLQTTVVDLAPLTDAESIERAARDLVDEACAADGERQVARRVGRRWLRRFEPLAIPPAERESLPLKERGVYLVTGGLGGIGLTVAHWLATQASARLVLTTRTALAEPPDARSAPIVEAIAAIEQAGGEVLVAVADAADEGAMSRAIEAALVRWGAIDGVIHAAGLAGSGGIAFRKEASEVDSVLAPKVEGLAVLVRLLGGVALDFVALFSSVNSVYGSPGICDYTSANAVLDAFADAASRPAAWRRVVAFDWGPWREVGMAARVVVPEAQRKDREAFLRLAIAPSAGAEAFGRVLASGRRRVIVVPFDLPMASALVRAQQAAEPPPVSVLSEPPPPSQARPDISSTFAAPSTETEKRVAAIWQELLGVARVGVHDDFFELGGHSLLATRVLARVEHVLGARLTLRDIFDAPTVERLSKKIDAGGARADASPVAEAEGDREEIEF